MSKRFPVPEFDRDQYKNLSWEQPKILSQADRDLLCKRADAGDASAYGAYPVAVEDAFLDRFDFEGVQRHALMCVTPSGAKLTARSWAWPIQRSLIVDSLEADSASVLHDWQTPRPMNTRLGPDQGVSIPSKVTYALLGQRYGVRWIFNRTLTKAAAAERRGFTVCSAVEGSNDFHACNLTFSWA